LACDAITVAVTAARRSQGDSARVLQLQADPLDDRMMTSLRGDGNRLSSG